MPKHPTPFNATPDDEGNEVLPNGKKLGWKAANAIFEGFRDNWGKIVSFGLGTVITIWLMRVVIIPMSLLVMDSYKANDEVQRKTAIDNASSVKSIASSMASMAVNDQKRTAEDEKRTLIIESTKNMQKVMLEQQRESLEIQKKMIVVQSEARDAALANGKKIDTGNELAHNERTAFWQPTAKVLQEMSESDKRREKIQLGILEEQKKCKASEDAHADEVRKALKK